MSEEKRRKRIMTEEEKQGYAGKAWWQDPDLRPPRKHNSLEEYLEFSDGAWEQRERENPG